MSRQTSSAIKKADPAGRPRPTKEEAMELSIIMSTPPSSGDFLTPIPNSQQERRRRSKCRETRSHSLPNIRPLLHPLLTPLVSPDAGQTSSACLPSLPKIKIGPPYESSLPFQATSGHQNKFILRPRNSLSSSQKKSLVQSASSLLAKQFCHAGLGPFLSNLPESIIYSIVNFIDYRERHPKLCLISHGMTSILTRPDFLLETKHIHMDIEDGATSINFNEFLFVVGGKYPTKASDVQHDNHVENDERLPRRMPFRRNDLGIMGYDMKRQIWMRFGGDPNAPVAVRSGTHDNLNDLDLHPLSEIVDAKPLYVGHPYYILLFFGGTHHETGLPSNRVIAYSFLTARWDSFPEMMRARCGEDFIVARVEGNHNSRNDCIVLIGKELEFCDCLRCNPPPSSDRPDVCIDMITFADNEFDEISSKQRMKRDYLHSIRKCEILDLKTRTWTRSQSRAPFSPPDDGGVAVVKGRYVYLPGTCPPPPSSAAWNHTLEGASEATAEIVTPMSQSETNSYAGLSQSPPSSIGELHSAAIVDYDQLSTTSMDIERDSLDVELTPLETLYRSLHYRPGLVYDAWADSWCTLPARQFVTTSSPTTCTFRDHVLVLGGYQSSSENALSCYRHREEEAILDYEQHLDYTWYYIPNTSKPGQDATFEDSGEWQFGGGTTLYGHRQSWGDSSDIASAVAAAAAIQNNDAKDESIHLHPDDQMPNRAPFPVRGASATIFQGRLTVFGGLSTFSRTFYDKERKNIYCWYPETREWRRACLQLPVPALLGGYAFSLHI
ncbi:hypothetical protein ACHAXM_007572 [Skeletonema potamos]